MEENKIKINVETEGFEEAMQQVEALVEAYEGFPAQVTIKNCKDCTINIYASQTKIIDTGDEKNERRQQEPEEDGA